MSQQANGETRTATETPAKTKPKTSPPKVDKLPPYRVLLHNDDVNDMVHVVETLELLTPLTRQQSYKVMIEAHTKGRALVTVTHRERAELYQEQLLSRSLTATIEPGP